MSIKFINGTDSATYIMENVLIVPVGQQLEPLLEGLRHVRGIRRIYLLSTGQSENVAKDFKEKVKPIYNECKIVLTSPDNLDKIISSLLEILRENYGEIKGGSRSVVINLTGGTKMMSIGCYMVGLFVAEKIVYIFKNRAGGMDLVDVPFVRVELEDFTKKKGMKLRILKRLAKGSMLLDSIAEEFKLKKPTVWSHLKKLEERQLVSKMEKGKSMEYSLTATGRLWLSMEDIKNGK